MGKPDKPFTIVMAEDDIRFCYEMGVNSYITKPVAFRGPVSIMKVLSNYWFEVVELPPPQ